MKKYMRANEKSVYFFQNTCIKGPQYNITLTHVELS